MYCSSPSKRRSIAAILALSALASFLPAPAATAQAADRSPSRLPSLTEARRAVVAAEEHLTAVMSLELRAHERLAELSDREASLARQVADARDEARRWTIDAYVSDRDSVANLLAGSDSELERSARIVYATSAADQSQAAARRYDQLRSQVTPEVLAIAEGIADVEAARTNANNAVLAARANEAEAERQHALATERALAARVQAALVTTATTPPAAGAQPVAPAAPVAVVDDGLEGPPAPPGGPSPEQWAKLRHCEATGNYQAVSKSGKYRGAYQFDRQTWATLGPAGDPAAASPAEQDRRALLLYQSRGWRPWPQCGRYLR